MSAPPTLESIPEEILTNIGVHLALLPDVPLPASSTASPSDPSSCPLKASSRNIQDTSPHPHALIPLLQTSKYIHSQLCLKNNPRLYAEIFAERFDTGAILRREGERLRSDNGQGRGSDDEVDVDIDVDITSEGTGDIDVDVGSENIIGDSVSGRSRGIKARGMALELRRRCIALSDLHRAVRLEDAKNLKEEDVWTIYLMLLENDGKNLQYLLDPAPPPAAPPATAAPLSPTATSSAPRFHLPKPKTTPTTPARTGVLMDYLALYHNELVNDATQPGLPSTSCERVLLVWIIWLLTSRALIESEDVDVLEEFLFVLRPYVFAAGQFDIFFGPWTYPHLPLHPGVPPSSLPPLPPSTARRNPYKADLSLHPRSVAIEHYGRRLRIAPPVLSHAAIMNFFARVDKLLVRVQMVGNVTNIGNGNQITPEQNRVIVFQPRRTSRYTSYTSVDDSVLHDQDYKRLTRCIDPRSLDGMGIEDWYGRFNGCWEGNFSFFDFDAYRNMLSGEPSALYEGQFGEQSQVWKMREVYVRPIRTAGSGAGPSAPVPPSSSVPRRPQARTALSGLSEASEDSTTSSTNSETPASMSAALNAGFAPSTSAFDRIVPMLPNQGRTHSSSMTTNAVVSLLERNPTDEHIVAMLGGLEGYEMVPAQEVERIIKRRTEGDENGDPCSEGDDLEIMLLGTGHSAWGEFLLRGRVRLWDGMANLVKEYSPDGRGKWVYRGYIVSGGVFVGRWRDCVTPDEYVGYEGTFTLSQRVDVAQ